MSFKELPKDILPTVMFRRRDINEVHAIQVKESVDLPTVLEREDALAYANREVRLNEYDDIDEKLTFSTSTVTQTKILESSLFDVGDGLGLDFKNIAINHWIYLISTGLYNTYIQIENPKTGDTVNLHVRDSFVLSWYLFITGAGFEANEIPLYPVEQIQRPGTIMPQDIYSIVNHKRISIELAYQVLENQPIINEPIISTFTFNDLIEEIYQQLIFQLRLPALQENSMDRAQVEAMVNRIYADKYVLVGDYEGQTFTEYFNSRDIIIEDYEHENPFEYYQYLVALSIGLEEDDDNRVTSIQRAMLGILSKLSSYTIQLIDNSFDDLITNPRIPPVRVDNNDGLFKSRFIVDHLPMRLLKLGSILKSKYYLQLNSLGPLNNPAIDSSVNEILHSKMNGKLSFEIKVKVRESLHSPNIQQRIFLKATPLRVSIAQELPFTNETIYSLPGSDIFETLTPEQRSQIHFV